MIVGGESGSGNLTRPFDLAWAEEILEHCRKNGVACFIKQLGRVPVQNGVVLKLHDPHGGDWDEWPEHLRVREFPRQFHDYRADEKRQSSKVRPDTGSAKAENNAARNALN